MTPSPDLDTDPSAPSPNAARRRIAMTLSTLVVAASVALMVAGEAGAGLVLLFWAVASWLALPHVVFVVLVAASALAAGYLALVLFVRVVRIDTRMARGESCDDIGWSLFPRRGGPDRA